MVLSQFLGVISSLQTEYLPNLLRKTKHLPFEEFIQIRSKAKVSSKNNVTLFS